MAVDDPSGLFSEQQLAIQNAADKSSTLTLIHNPSPGKPFDYDSAGFDAYLLVPALSWDKPDTSRLVLKAKKSYGTSSTALVEAKLNRLWDEI